MKDYDGTDDLVDANDWANHALKLLDCAACGCRWQVIQYVQILKKQFQGIKCARCELLVLPEVEEDTQSYARAYRDSVLAWNAWVKRVRKVRRTMKEM